ncbi:MAG: hypothetical protein AMXMBFR47_06340 [Planctomycetota bacterium]
MNYEGVQGSLGEHDAFVVEPVDSGLGADLREAGLGGERHTGHSDQGCGERTGLGGGGEEADAQGRRLGWGG